MTADLDSRQQMGTGQKCAQSHLLYRMMQLLLQPRHRRQKLKQQLLQRVSCNTCGTHSPHSGGFLASGDLQ